MAEAFSSILLDQLASFSTYLDNVKEKVKRKLILDVTKEVAEFTSKLEAIQPLLEDAERRQRQEDHVRAWFEDLKDVSNKMEDVLDVWNTEILKQKIQKQEKSENAVVTTKVCFSIPTDCFCFGQVTRQVLLDISFKIKDLNARLTVIVMKSETFNFQSTNIRNGLQQLEGQKTAPRSVDISKVFGREGEKEFLVNLLLSETNQEDGHLVIVPITGMGGVGKTTLAKIAYNNKKVRTHFERRIWVRCKDTFDDIAKAIIKSLNEYAIPNSTELEDFQECLSQSIQGKKFLLVLDDVWSRDAESWERFRLPLLLGAKGGSKIVVTTRLEEAARMMGSAATYMIRLRLLSDQDSLALFYHIALFDRKEDECNGFKDMAMKIASKCRGWPFVTKLLGSLMRYKKTIKEWHDVLDSSIWDLAENEQIFQMLLLSYYDLVPTLRRCLLYCAIFPEDYVFNRDNLIELWISQDYLYSDGNKEKEIIGQIYFDNLVMRSFFLDFEQDDYANIVGYTMHDLVRGFLQFLTKNEGFLVRDGFEPEHTQGSIMVRHLTIMRVPKGPFATTSLHINCENLRTLTLFDSNITSIDLDLMCLRTLNLSFNCIQKLPQEIGKLIHLRYIDLSHNRYLEELPATMCNLYNLQTLRLVGCRKLKKLPVAMGRLINLKYLYAKDCDNLKYVPIWIGRLTSLETLFGCILSCGDDNKAFKLGDVRRFESFQGNLSIRKLGNVKDVSVAKNVQMGNAKDLLGLELDFENDEDEQRKSDIEVLDALKPHQGLEFLSIGCYDGITMSPNWMMSLYNLTALTLDEWKYCQCLPPLGELLSLEKLEISGMHSLKKIGAELLGIETQKLLESSSHTVLFPKLNVLSFRIMQEWEEWEGLEGWSKEDPDITIMPCLSFLQINSCSFLKTLPDFLWETPLQELRFSWCPILERRYQKGRGKEWSKISHIPNIIIDDNIVQEDGVMIQQDNEISDVV